MRNLRFLSLCLALSLVCAYGANGRLVIFGDSLSDNGNLFAITGGYPPRPYGVTYSRTGCPTGYFAGRFTDGQNWVDYIPGVAQSFRSNIPTATAAYDPKNTLENATNFAIGGSTSKDHLNVLGEGLPSFPDQITKYLSVRGKSTADDQCVIWIGANDFGAFITPDLTVKNILDGIAQLSKAGVKKFVVIDLPDLSLTPLVRGLKPPPIPEARSFVYSVNVTLGVQLPLFALLNQVEVDLVDINTIFVPIVSSPRVFGFTNSVDAAFNLNTHHVVSDPNSYVFWDGFHPTTKVHLIAAEFIYGSIFLRRHFHDFFSLPIAELIPHE